MKAVLATKELVFSEESSTLIPTGFAGLCYAYSTTHTMFNVTRVERLDSSFVRCRTHATSPRMGEFVHGPWSYLDGHQKRPSGPNAVFSFSSYLLGDTDDPV
jgi:hypothetical protein